MIKMMMIDDSDDNGGDARGDSTGGLTNSEHFYI